MSAVCCLSVLLSCGKDAFIGTAVRPRIDFYGKVGYNDFTPYSTERKNAMSFWICTDERPSETHLYRFTRTFRADPGTSLHARSCADTRYRLLLNGHEVCEGPCQGSSYVRYYEESDLSPFLLPGENTLTAEVLYVQEGSFISVFRGSRPAFWMDGSLTLPDGSRQPLGTDDGWSCTREDAVSFHHVPGIHISIPPFEDVHGASVMTPVPVLRMYEPNLEGKGYNVFGLREHYPLTPRPIPQMQTEEAHPLTVLRRGNGWMELDAGAYTTAKVSFTFTAASGACVRMIYAECVTVEDAAGNRLKERRDAWDNPTARMDGVYDTVYATGERQVFSPFWYRAFRFIRLEFPEDAGFTPIGMTFSPYFYPMGTEGGFTCSDNRLNRMWEVSRNTVLCCTHEMFVDCPYYEQQQYDMDSCLEMLFTFRLTDDARMPLKSLTDLAHSQMADGMLQANYPSTDVQIIPDFTLFWVLMLREYLRHTGTDAPSREPVRALLGTMDKSLGVFENYMTEDGLIGPTPYWPFVDWVPGWPVGVPNGGREEPLTVTCLMYAAALRAGSEICRTLGRTERAAEYERRAEAIIGRVNALCYDTDAGLYRNTPSRREFSQHTTLWAVLSGAVSGEEAGSLVDRTFDGHVPAAVCTFSMNHYLFRALEAAGRYKTYAPRLLEGWQHMLELHCTTWCENPDSPRSECHGWSSAPIYEFSRMILGAFPTQDGWNCVSVQPFLPDGVTFAEGTVPTPHGTLSIRWDRDGSSFTLTVRKPEGAPMQVTAVLPDGKVVPMSDGSSLTAGCTL